MFEFIKLIVDAMNIPLHIDKFRAVRKKGNYNQVGANLFIIHLLLIRLLNNGRSIRSTIANSADWAQRNYENSPDKEHSSRLGVDLRDQYFLIMMLLGRIGASSMQIDFIATDVRQALTNSLIGKLATIDRLLIGAANESSFMIDVNTQKFIEAFSDEKVHHIEENEGMPFHRLVMSRQDRLLRQITKRIGTGGPSNLNRYNARDFKWLDELDSYLKEKKADETLDLIESMSANLRSSVIEHFDLAEIYADVEKYFVREDRSRGGFPYDHVLPSADEVVD